MAISPILHEPGYRWSIEAFPPSVPEDCDTVECLKEVNSDTLMVLPTMEKIGLYREDMDIQLDRMLG